MKKFFLFLKDIFKARYNSLDSGSKSTYQALRFLYFISDGFLLKPIESWITKKNIFSLFFNKNLTYKILPEIDDISASLLKAEILRMQPYSNNEKSSLKFLNDKSVDLNNLDFDYYKRNKIVKLEFDSNEIIQNEYIINFIKKFLNTKFIKMMKEFSNTNIRLVHIDSWITLPILNNEQEELNKDKDYDKMTNVNNTLQWHRDWDYIRDIKLFIYLNDVNDEEDGCFQIIEGSNNFSFFSPFKYRDLGGLRVPNKVIMNNFNYKIKSFFGKKGTNFLADTRGLHRGLAIKNNKSRHILQFVFSCHSLGTDMKLNFKKNYPNYNQWNDLINNNYDFYSALFDKETLMIFSKNNQKL